MFRVLFAFVGATAVGLVVLIAHVAGFLLVWACAIAAALCWIVAAFCFAVWLLTGAEGGLLKASVFFAYGLVPFSAMLAAMAAQAWAEDLPDRIGAARGKRRRLEAAGREMQRRLPAGARAPAAEDAPFDP